MPSASESMAFEKVMPRPVSVTTPTIKPAAPQAIATPMIFLAAASMAPKNLAAFSLVSFLKVLTIMAVRIAYNAA